MNQGSRDNTAELQFRIEGQTHLMFGVFLGESIMVNSMLGKNRGRPIMGRWTLPLCQVQSCQKAWISRMFAKALPIVVSFLRMPPITPLCVSLRVDERLKQYSLRIVCTVYAVCRPKLLAPESRASKSKRLNCDPTKYLACQGHLTRPSHNFSDSDEWSYEGNGRSCKCDSILAGGVWF